MVTMLPAPKPVGEYVQLAVFSYLKKFGTGSLRFQRWPLHNTRASSAQIRFNKPNIQLTQFVSQD